MSDSDIQKRDSPIEGARLRAMPPPMTVPAPAEAATEAPPPRSIQAEAAPARKAGDAAATIRVPNRVYDHLVEGDDDVIGLIAYSLYKHDKRQWLMTWRKQHGSDPSADHVEAFVNAQMTFGQRDRYRAAARQVLDAYALVAVDMEKAQITRDAVAGRVESAAKRVESSGRWWRQIPGIVVGGILSVGILIGVIAVLVALDFDIGRYLGIATVTPPTPGAADVVP